MAAKKISIEIKHRLYGTVLFKYEAVDNTISRTLAEAINGSADLYDANLRDANLRDANLRGANLRDANLRDANLRDADLRGANLRGADLRGANLYDANLRDADLRGADLRGANLYDANLRDANLRDANLRDANLYDANLRDANLRDANLRDANLRDANLRGANLRDADLRDANLYDAKNAELAIAMTRILPEGTLIGYKKCAGDVIVKLEIPAEAKRSHAFGRKCRAEYAKVLEIYGATEADSEYDGTFKYRQGEIVKPVKPFSDDWASECESGIHFFITRLEAENYN